MGVTVFVLGEMKIMQINILVKEEKNVLR